MPEILICNDHRNKSTFAKSEYERHALLEQHEREAVRIELNEQGAFASTLQRHGFSVRVFDGRDSDLHSRFETPADAAEFLETLFESFHPAGILYDLQYWSDQEYGIKLLDTLIQRGCLSISSCRFVFLTIRKFSIDEHALLKKYPFAIAVEYRLDFSERRVAKLLTDVPDNHPLLKEFRK